MHCGYLLFHGTHIQRFKCYYRNTMESYNCAGSGVSNVTESRYYRSKCNVSIYVYSHSKINYTVTKEVFIISSYYAILMILLVTFSIYLNGQL